MRARTPAIAWLALAALPALAAPDSPLEALDTATQHVVQQVQASVVSLEVERTNYGPRELTAPERQLLGVVMPYDLRYFTRPEGPCSAVVIGPQLLATSTYNVEARARSPSTPRTGARSTLRGWAPSTTSA